MSERVRIPMQVTPNPSVDINEDFNGSTMPFPGAPVAITINVPTELITIARTYPAIDWNEVMGFAVQGGVK